MTDKQNFKQAKNEKEAMSIDRTPEETTASQHSLSLCLSVRKMT